MKPVNVLYNLGCAYEVFVVNAGTGFNKVNDDAIERINFEL